jgi:hypothetical protein
MHLNETILTLLEESERSGMDLVTFIRSRYSDSELIDRLLQEDIDSTVEIAEEFRAIIKKLVRDRLERE